jgi:hypothetical protein
MNKIFAASLFLGLASMSQAATITFNCSPSPSTFNGPANVAPGPATGGGNEVCTGSIAPGSTINSVTLNWGIDSSYDRFNAGFGSDIVTFSFTGPGTLASGNGTVNSFSAANTGANSANSGSSGNGGPVVCSNAACVAAALAGSITIVDAYASTQGNTALSSITFSKQIIVDYTAPVTGTPEPSTFVMLGTALTALGAIARRRKA